jgi:hypothetical protein
MKKLPDEFYPITPTAAKKLRKANLTASEWKIWSYLVEVDPWGDRYHEVETMNLLSACEVSKATYYRAIAKFQEEKIFDFQDKGFNIRNLNGISKIKDEKNVSEMRTHQSQNCDDFLKNEKVVAEMRQLSQNCENRGSKLAPSKDSETPKISLDLKDQLDRSDQDDFLNFENTIGKKVMEYNIYSPLLLIKLYILYIKCDIKSDDIDWLVNKKIINYEKAIWDIIKINHARLK